MLKAYELYGGGKLTAEEEARYWQDCARAAEFQTCDPADVPRTREGINEYFEQMRPHLAVSEAARAMMDHLLNAKVVLPPAPRAAKPAVEILNWFLRAGTIATMPRWMRRLSGFDQPRAVDLAVRPVLKLGFGLVNRVPRLKLLVAKIISPSVVPIAGPYIMGIPPRSTEVLSPEEGRKRYGYVKPADAHKELRARQHERVFGRGQLPSDEGLIESQSYLGSLA